MGASHFQPYTPSYFTCSFPTPTSEIHPILNAEETWQCHNQVPSLSQQEHPHQRGPWRAPPGCCILRQPATRPGSRNPGADGRQSHPKGTQSHPPFPDAHCEGPGAPREPGAGGGAHLPWLAPGSYISSRFWKLMLAYALESSLGWPLPRGWLGDLGCGGGGGFPPDREAPSAAGCRWWWWWW